MKAKRKYTGFTLIELLVVVLIIGILSAVAFPQYQKAVWKSKATQLRLLAKSLAEAQTAYYLANNAYSADFASLDIGFDSLPLHPSSPTNSLSTRSSDGVRANDEMELVINGQKNSWLFSVALFKTGPYAGTGFGFNHVSDGVLTANKWYCEEYGETTAGNFCVKVMGLTSTPISTLEYRYYSLD